jgi:hypothetical protein
MFSPTIGWLAGRRERQMRKNNMGNSAEHDCDKLQAKM